MIDLDWRPKLNPDGTIAFDQSDNQPRSPFPDNLPEEETENDDEEIIKAHRLSSTFGSGRGRRAQLIRRLKSRRQYGKPVRGGTGKQARSRRKKWG